MDADMSAIFIQEATNHIVKINAELLACEEKGVSEEPVKVLKSEVHTLKGDSRMLGFQSISMAAHKIEDFIQLLDNATKEKETEILKILFAIMDAIEAAVDALPGEKIEIDLTPFQLPAGESQEASPGADSPQAAPVQKEAPAPAPQKQEPEKKGAPEETHSEYISINLEKITSLVKVSSLFPRYSSRFNFILNRLREIEMTLSKKLPEDSQCKQLEDLINELSHELAFFDLSSRHFQDEVTRLKLVPLETIFKFFPRLVRDVAHNTGKKVNLSIVGSEVELDKSIVESFKNILIHILRNAVDHGIEGPDERKQLAKQETGRIHLSAVNRGDNVEVEVSDDGQGLDLERIRSKALEVGLISQAEAEQMGESDLSALIFSSGFTTKQVGDFSGRGVGMDSVARTLKEIGGEIRVRSVRGKGTTFTVTLPLVSSYIPVTIFGLGERLYGIPSTYIQLVSLAKRSELKRDKGDDNQLYLSLHQHEIGLLDLQEVFGLGKCRDIENLKLIICRHQEDVTGFIVSEVVLEKKLVISRTTALTDRLNVILGGVLLGMERVIPVLNIPQLFRYLKEKTLSISRIKEVGENRFDIGFKTILLVEDSLVTRTSEKKLLIKQNFNVLEANNGQVALEILENSRVDCIFTDIEMPIMNGIELIGKLKSNPALAGIPVIVVSSYQDYSERLRAMGVHHFINKGQFSNELLVKTLKEAQVL